MKNLVILSLLLTTTAFTSLSAHNGESFFSEAGVRIGFDSESHADLVSYEAFGIIDQDWSWELCEHAVLDLDITSAIGGISGEGETAAYGHIGLLAELSFVDFPISIVLSSGPSLLSEDQFDNYDLGSHLQFTSTIGIELSLIHI